MANGHRLNTSIILAAVHGLSGLFRAVSAVELSLFRPLPPTVPVPNKPPRFCGRKTKWSILTTDTEVGAPSTVGHLSDPNTRSPAVFIQNNTSYKFAGKENSYFLLF